MNSRPILVATIAILLIVFCVGVYFLFFGGKTSPPGVTTGGSSGSLPDAGTQSVPNSAGAASSSTSNASLQANVSVVINQPVIAYTTNASGTITAVEPDGEIIQATNGQIATLSSIAMQNVIGASFSYDGAKALVSFGDPTSPQTSVFTVKTKAWTPLPAGLLSPVWSPYDYRIAYVAANANQGTETVGTLNAAATKPAPTALLALHMQDLALVWPTKTRLVLETKPSAYVVGSAWSINPGAAGGGSLTPVAFEVPGLDLLWSTGDLAPAAPEELEFSGRGASIGGSLSLVDALGNVLQNLKFFTLPSKCAFASQMATTTAGLATSTPYLFCGVPRDQNTLSYSHLPDDYNQMSLFTSDDIYQVNLESGTINTLFNNAASDFDVSDVRVSGGILYFINRYDQALYTISAS